MYKQAYLFYLKVRRDFFSVSPFNGAFVSPFLFSFPIFASTHCALAFAVTTSVEPLPSDYPDAK